jgi:hypothetical protein
VHADHAGQLAGTAVPGEVTRLQPDVAGPAWHRAAQLGGRGLAVQRTLEQAFLTGLAEELQQALGGPAQRTGRRDASETLHRGVPRDHGKARVGDDYRVVEAVDDARSKVIHVLDEYSASGARSTPSNVP